MSRTRSKPGALLVLSWALVLTACGGPATPEEQVRDRIAEMEEAGENGERGRFMSMVAEDFQGQGGAMQRDDFQAFLLLQLNRHQQVRAQLFPVTVELAGDDEARASFRALMTGGRGLLPDSGAFYEIETWWVLRDDEWLLSEARWHIGADPD